MPLYDFLCERCTYKEADMCVNSSIRSIPCPQCKTAMLRLLGIPNFNLKTSDLPHSGWDTYQPAFKKHCSSKREAMSSLRKMNRSLEEEASKEGRKFNEFVWTPEPDTKIKEMLELRKEMGPKAVDDRFKQEIEEANHKKFTKDLDLGLRQVAEGLDG